MKLCIQNVIKRKETNSMFTHRNASRRHFKIETVEIPTNIWFHRIENISYS